MSEYFLYYAGMSGNMGCEQIGLATSADGEKYRRVKNSGLIIEKNPGLKWKDLRVCNPAVIPHRNEFVMYYQGISSDNLNTSIGLATSSNGVDWNCREEPCISLELIKKDGLDCDYTGRMRLVEPTVFIEDGRFKMWFVIYMNQKHPGNSLVYAESPDGENWKVMNFKLLTGNQFGPYNLHYPQVIKNNSGYAIYFTLQNLLNGVYGIFKMDSSDGVHWENLGQVLPESHRGFCLEHRKHFDLTLFSRNIGRISSTLNRKYSSWFRRGANYFGYAHPHLLEKNGSARLYYHNNNIGPDNKIWMDIGCCDIENSGKVGRHYKVLEKNPDTKAWDSFFVADPYVICL